MYVKRCLHLGTKWYTFSATVSRGELEIKLCCVCRLRIKTTFLPNHSTSVHLVSVLIIYPGEIQIVRGHTLL